MNNDRIEGKWHELKGKFKSEYAKITDDELEQSKGNFEELSGKLQKHYGKSKDEANKAIDEFTKKHLS
jgi:uncharacterized protein YjbJ (UPF0337 family)